MCISEVRITSLSILPCKLKPDDGPHISPSRHSFNDMPNASLEPISSIASTESRQGNSTGLSSARDRGPGTRSPAAVQTLGSGLTKAANTGVQHLPQSYHGRFGALEVLPKPCHCTRSTHSCTYEVDVRKLFVDLWASPFDVRLPILEQVRECFIIRGHQGCSSPHRSRIDWHSTPMDLARPGFWLGVYLPAHPMAQVAKARQTIA